jgi:hypothetical protein
MHPTGGSQSRGSSAPGWRRGWEWPSRPRATRMSTTAAPGRWCFRSRRCCCSTGPMPGSSRSTQSTDRLRVRRSGCSRCRSMTSWLCRRSWLPPRWPWTFAEPAHRHGKDVVRLCVTLGRERVDAHRAGKERPDGPRDRHLEALLVAGINDRRDRHAAGAVPVTVLGRLGTGHAVRGLGLAREPDHAGERGCVCGALHSKVVGPVPGDVHDHSAQRHEGDHCPREDDDHLPTLASARSRTRMRGSAFEGRDVGAANDLHRQSVGFSAMTVRSDIGRVFQPPPPKNCRIPASGVTAA